MGSFNTEPRSRKERQSHNNSLPCNNNSSPTKFGKRRIADFTDENQNPNVDAKRVRSHKQNAKNKIIEQYQPLLRKYEKDEKLVILEAEEESGTKPGQNYLSRVLRTKVSGTRGNGKPYKKSFIRKIEVESEAYRTEYRTGDLFLLEAHMYENLLPRLGNIGPKCVFSQPGEIILEDLGQRQFNTYEIRNFFDLDHCLAVVQTLASMHAKSLSLKLNEQDTFERLIAPLNENVFRADEGPSMSVHYENGIGIALADLQSIESNSSELRRAVEFLREYKSKVVATMKELLSPKISSDRYWVITHGDTWKNNIMFHHDERGNVVNVKLVDFQVARHSSAALDFTYFLYTSAHTEVMEHHTDSIIAEYERFFLHDLRRSEAPESDLKAFSPGWFKRELERYGLFGFFGALTTINAIFMDEKRAALHEKSKTGTGEMPSGVDSSKEKTERILFMTNHYIKHFRKDV